MPIDSNSCIRPQMIQSLIYKLVGSPLAHETIIKYRLALKKIYIDLRFTEAERHTLKAILLYDELFGKAPESLDNILDFTRTACEELFHHRDTIAEEIKELKEGEDECKDKDINVIVINCIKKARKYWFLDALDHCMGIALNGPSRGADGKRGNPSGVDDAKQELYRRLGADASIDPSVPGGIWQENTANTEQKLSDYINKKKNSRVKLGFGAIDRKFVIRHGKTVVVAGMAGDGKTSFLTSAVYNMSAAGENILYITMESKPDEIWENLAFIHCDKYRDRFHLPAVVIEFWALSRMKHSLSASCSVVRYVAFSLYWVKYTSVIMLPVCESVRCSIWST
jgi:hypothetical protein